MIKLERHEIDSMCWQKIKEHYTERLGELRLKLEGSISEDETRETRVKIRECKELLKLGSPPTGGREY